MSDVTTYTTLPTYDKLVEAVKVYLNRYDEDTLQMVPFFINAAEKTILRNMRMPSMEKMIGFTIEEVGVEEEGWVPLPSDYLEMKFVWTDRTTLQRVTFDQLLEDRSSIERLLTPDCTRPIWAINANRMYIRGISSSEMLYLTYYADIPEISETTQTNVLLDLLPDSFLFFSVAEGFRFLMEEAKSDYWEGQALKRMNEVRAQVEDAEFSGSPLIIQPMM